MKKPPADMLEAAKKVLPNAYAPYSHFCVAATVRATDGTLFAGCNVENAAFPLGICAEAGAVSALFAQGYKAVTEILVLVPGNNLCSPCGACRQRFLECADLNTSVHLCTTNGDYDHCTVSELLPKAFGPKNLENV